MLYGTSAKCPDPPIPTSSSIGVIWSLPKKLKFLYHIGKLVK